MQTCNSISIPSTHLKSGCHKRTTKFTMFISESSVPRNCCLGLALVEADMKQRALDPMSRDMGRRHARRRSMSASGKQFCQPECRITELQLEALPSTESSEKQKSQIWPACPAWRSTFVRSGD